MTRRGVENVLCSKMHCTLEVRLERPLSILSKHWVHFNGSMGM